MRMTLPGPRSWPGERTYVAARRSVSGLLADPDRDQLVNLLEYAFDSAPLTPSDFPVKVTRTAEAVEMRYSISDAITDLLFEPEASSDLRAVDRLRSRSRSGRSR